MVALYCGALLLCLAVTIVSAVCTNHVHAIHTHSAAGQLTRSNLTATFIIATSAFTSCALTWALVVNHAPQSGAFSPWYVAEALLLLMGASTFLCWTMAVAIIGNTWNRGAIKHHTSPSSHALFGQLSTTKKHHLLWSLRRRLTSGR